MHRGEGNPEAAAILAADGCEASEIARTLDRDGMRSSAYPDLLSFSRGLGRCAYGIVAEEAVEVADLDEIAGLIASQPEWSDYPFILLTNRGEGADRAAIAQRYMQLLGNVIFLERPFHPTTLLSLARTALASRRRQYQARDRVASLEASRSEIARSDELLKFTLDAGQLGTWDLNFPERELKASERCKSIFGLGPEAEFTYPVFLDRVHPEDRERMRGAVQTALDTRADCEVACRVVTPGGEIRWVEIRGRGSYEGERAVRLTGVTLDITQRKLAEERQHLLIRELHHRVKNTLSTVQAIVGSTARGATTIEDFYRDFSGRIQSLANTHTLLTEELWQRASIHELVAKELRHFADGHSRITISGPDIELPSEYAVPLGMAFHELSANAAKHGALSTAAGRIEVRWAVEPDAAADRLRLEWVEEDGPVVVGPARQGFGTRLLERVLTAQLNAEVGIRYDPGGVKVSLAFSLPKAATKGARRFA